MTTGEGLLPATTAERTDRGRTVTAGGGLLPVATRGRVRRAALRPGQAGERAFTVTPAAGGQIGGER
ncbi:hypothetical protein [Streptomyces durhamensis]|uniref:hypothetical protein n=1 Tax=Streptomyces durhamensis TaxID=68194 RepID=UPI0004CD6E3A|nr:hypothetical protein [Streptomyces durhamensis]